MMGKPKLEASLSGSREDVIDRVTTALKSEGFGVLTRIDIDRAFAEKLGIDFRPYSILGACNPGLAHQALSGRADVGLMLPCNVVVDEESPGRSRVRILDPLTMLEVPGYEDDDELAEVGRAARKKLVQVASALTQGTGDS